MPSDREPLPRDRAALRRFLAARGLRPRRGLGQHFMVDPVALGALVAAGEVQPGEAVLEVGTGTGLLTRRLLEAGAEVLTVEADPELARAVGPSVAAAGARLILGDVLAGPAGLHPEVLAWARARAERGYKVVANLPYAVATPFLLRILRLPARPRLLAVTLQRELADRLAAPPGTRAYGRVSVEVQLRARVERLRQIGRRSFWPAPRVDSSLLRLLPYPQGMQPAPSDEEAFLSLLRRAFAQRRKQLRRLLGASAEAALGRLGLRPDLRAEALTPAEFVALFEMLRSPGETGAANTLPPSQPCDI